MTREEKEIREALGPFKVVGVGDRSTREFDAREFKRLASEVSRIYSDEHPVAEDENNH